MQSANERDAKRSAEYAMGRGKNGKGRDEAAMRVHDEWAGRFRRLRNGAANTGKSV